MPPDIEEMSTNNSLRIVASGSFHELLEEEGKKKGVFRVIKPGWSNNGYHYSPEVTAQLVNFIESKPMFFADHLEPAEKKNMVFGQKTHSAVAMAEKVWADQSGEIFAKLSPIGNPNTEWLWEAAQKFPDQIGLSIDAYGKVKKGEAEGKKGFIVEQFTGYDSTDFVYRPAAGGKFISLTEATQIDESQEVSSTIQEAAKTLADVIKKHTERNLFWGIGNILVEFLWGIAIDYKMSDEDKAAAINKALEDFISKMKSVDIVKLFNSEIKDPLKKLESKLEEPMDIKETIEAVKSLTAAQLQEYAPDLVTSVVNASLENKKLQEALKTLPTLQQDNGELIKQVTKLETDLAESNKAKEAAEVKLKAIEDKEVKVKWENDVQEAIKTSGLPEAVITEAFKSVLFEQKSIEKVKELIEDRKVAHKVTFDNGKPTVVTPTIEGKPAGSINLDQLATDIKGNN